MKRILNSFIFFTSWCHLLALQPEGCSPSLDPINWPAEKLQLLETQQYVSWTPERERITSTSNGLIAATVSPIAVEAGRCALNAGGTAVDAAITVALTQITTELGSVVSYAGILTALYYDAGTGRITALDAGYDSYAEETEPLSIPAADLGPLRPDALHQETDAHGRKTLVPGFMAGIEALHTRYGNLPFHDLFMPAISFAEKGVLVSPILEGCFQLRATAFQRTREGRAFLKQSGRDIPQVGDRFVQSDLAMTLRAIAENGAQEMYHGDWAKAFVETVQHEGGKVTAEDLASYQPTWTEPSNTDAFGAQVYMTPLPNTGAYGVTLGLHLAETLDFNQQNPISEDPVTWSLFSRIAALASTAPFLDSTFAASLKAEGIESDPAQWLTREFSKQLASRLSQNPVTPSPNMPHHSNSIAVIDKCGNICVLTHTINAVLWGGTGIVVGGIPIPDSAGFQQPRLATVIPGNRVPHEIVDTIVLREGTPVMATASIGSSLAAETLRILISKLGHHQSLQEIMKAPTHLSLFGPAPLDATADSFSVLVPDGAYDKTFIAAVQREGISALMVPTATVDALRGTVAVIALDSDNLQWMAVEESDVMVFHAAQKEASDE